MENASKALLIAGGILIAIIILTMLIMMFNRMASIQKTQEEKTKMEQIAAFNAEYEAFNKKVMYGTDIITIVNKAKQNNLNMKAQIPENRYYININITIKGDTTFASKVEQKNLQTGYITTYLGKEASEKAAEFNVNISEVVLNGGKTYSLGNWENDKVNMNSDIMALFESDTDDFIEQTTVRGVAQTCYIYSALTQFKTSLFKCTEVIYDDEGRIKEMSFEQR